MSKWYVQFTRCTVILRACNHWLANSFTLWWQPTTWVFAQHCFGNHFVLTNVDCAHLLWVKSWVVWMARTPVFHSPERRTDYKLWPSFPYKHSVSALSFLHISMYKGGKVSLWWHWWAHLLGERLWYFPLALLNNTNLLPKVTKPVIWALNVYCFIVSICVGF